MRGICFDAPRGAFTIAVVFMAILFSSISSPARNLDQSAARRLAAVENGISAPVEVAGEPAQKWSIAMQLRRYHIPAVSVAVVDDYQIDWASAWGVTGGRRAATSDTRFYAGAAGKPVLAMALLHLVQEGKLNLDTDVNSYLSSRKLLPRPGGTLVTLRELLSLPSGSHAVPGKGHPRDAILASWPEVSDGLIPVVAHQDWVADAPNLDSNYPDAIIRRVITDVSGMPFTEFMDKTVLHPLGMRRSTYAEPAGSTSLRTTPSDLARLSIALIDAHSGIGNPVISAAAGMEMLSPQLLRTGGTRSGLGVLLMPSPLGTRFSQIGQGPGFSAFMVGYSSGRGIIVMTNARGGMAVALPIARAVERVYGWNTYPDVAAK